MRGKSRQTIVTGASRGIGRQIALDLALSGHRVLAIARPSDSLNELGSVLSEHFDGDVLELDLDDPNAARAICDSIDGDVQVLVHNVGGDLGVSNPLGSSDDFMRVMRHNLALAIDLNSHFVPRMQQRGWGRVVHVSSVASVMASIPFYSAAKASLNSYVRALGNLVKEDGVVVTSLMPGAVLTEGGYWDEALSNKPELVEKFISERMAIGRLGLPSDISSVAQFIVSDDAGMLSGACILVDGGHSRVIQTVETA